MSSGAGTGLGPQPLFPAHTICEEAGWASQGLRKGNSLRTANPQALCFLWSCVLGEETVATAQLGPFEFLPSNLTHLWHGAQFEILGSDSGGLRL